MRLYLWKALDGHMGRLTPDHQACRFRGIAHRGWFFGFMWFPKWRG